MSFDYQSFIVNHPAKKVLGKGADAQARRENAFRFVNTCANDLRKLGHNNVAVYQKTSGDNAFGYASDIIVISNNLFDCVVGSEETNASPAYQDKGAAEPDRIVMPDPLYLVPSTEVPPVEPPVNPSWPALPTYSQWGDENEQLAAKYVQKHGHNPGPRDFGHWSWRRFQEHWKFEDMLADV
jgi:hypothetical protein